MAYRYLALTQDGEQARGILDVATEEAAERALWRRELTILELKEEQGRLELAKLFPTLLGPKPRDVILFSRQLATLVESGVPITAALELLSSEISNRYLAKVVGQIEDDVRIGSSLSAALGKHHQIFSNLYCRMVEIGERSGNLGPILRQLSDYIERTQAALAKARGAMAYPAFIFALAIFVVLILINVALPPMVRLFREFGAELPWPTVVLLGLAQFVTDHGAKVIGALIALGLGLAFYSTRESGRRRLHALLLRLPIFGSLGISAMVARLARTLSILLGAGLALPESLSLTSQTITNLILAEALQSVRQEALQGRGLSGPLARTGYFPRMLSYLVRVGEETGTLGEHLGTAADFYEGEVERALRVMIAVLEPALVLAVGLMVGFVAVSIILPMYDLLGAIR